MKKRERFFFFSEKMLQKKESKGKKKVVEMRRHWSVVCAQIEVHTPQLSLYTCNRGSSQSFLRRLRFLFFGGKKHLHHDRDIDHHHRCAAFCRSSSTVSEHSELGELVFPPHTAMYLYLWHHDSFSCTTLSSTIGKLNNSTSQTSVSSRPLFSLGFFSCAFLHPCSSINPTLHHLFSTHPSSSFSESISTPKHCKGASTSSQSFEQFLSLSSSPKPSLDINLSLVMVVAHVLFADDESRGDSISSSLLVSSSKSLSCSFHNFLFFWHDLPLIFDTDHRILQVQLHRLKLPNLSSNFL